MFFRQLLKLSVVIVPLVLVEALLERHSVKLVAKLPVQVVVYQVHFIGLKVVSQFSLVQLLPLKLGQVTL